MNITTMKSNKILGIGFNKTGTTSLGTFLEQLNLGPVCSPLSTRTFFQTTYHSIPAPDKKRLSKFKENYYNFPHRNMLNHAVKGDHISDILLFAKYFNSFEDRPWNTEIMYKTMHDAYPDAKFILTRRKPHSWWLSVSKWLKHKSAKDKQIINQYLMHLGVPNFSEKEFIDAYCEYNAHAISYFQVCSKNNFLVLDLEEEGKAMKIMKFLGLSCDHEEYPHENQLIRES